MTESNGAPRHPLGSNLTRVATHVTRPDEYDDLPELTDEMLARGTVNKGGRPRSTMN